MQAFDLAVRFGIRIVEVPNLGRPVVYVRECDIALVNSDLDPEGRARAADWLLSVCLSPGPPL